MLVTTRNATKIGGFGGIVSSPAGLFWFTLCILATLPLFWLGFTGLVAAWSLPEYSHGPIIPILSFYMYLREMRAVPPTEQPITDRTPGVLILGAALALAMVGNLAQINDLVFYALIIWTFGFILTCYGARRGLIFWPSVLHLVFMLPMPQFIYWKIASTLQLVSSEIGVWFVALMGVPVFLEGNVIDLGVYKLQVAEACSGLRYLFPIMSFSYVFAVLYRGSVWHKIVLLLAAVPIAVVMNSFRIGVIGVLVDRYGIAQAEGFLHFFEGWIIFLSCIVLMFGMVKAMQWISGDRRPLGDAIDLDFTGLGGQFMRVFSIKPSRGLITAALLTATLSGAWVLAPRQEITETPRDPFALFPLEMDDWSGATSTLDPEISAALGADDYLAAWYQSPTESQPVDFFVSYYRDQTNGNAIHSPEVCLPASGWEVFSIRPTEITLPGTDIAPLQVNRAIIQKGLEKQLVYYWFETNGQRMTSSFALKFATIFGGMTRGRTDGGLVRVITPIDGGGEAAADARLRNFMSASLDRLGRFMPE